MKDHSATSKATRPKGTNAWLLFPRYPLAEGLSISRIVTGLSQVADQQRAGREFDVDQAALAMSPYVDAGLTTFDMGDADGSAEDIAGIFGDRAERLTRWGPKPGSISRESVRESVQRALRRLRTDRLDLIQFHAWTFANPSWLDALLHLQELKREGLINHLGVSNFDTTHLRMAVQSGLEIVSNQVSLSVIDTRALGAMSEYCLAHKIRLLAYGTLMGGFVSDKWLGKNEPEPDALETWSLARYARLIKTTGGWSSFQQVLRRLDEVATKHGVSIANVASRFVLEQDAVAAIVVGARLTKSEHIEDTMRVFDLTLDDDDHRTLTEGFAYLKPLTGDCGDEFRKPPYLTETGSPSPNFDPHQGTPPYAVRPGPKGRTLVIASNPVEAPSGSSIAHRLDDRIWISAIGARHGERLIGGNDARSQFHFTIDRIEGLLISLGAHLTDVVRTRVYVRNAYDWEDIAKAHSERFRHILPANTLVQADLIGDEQLVEVEAEAVVNT